MSTPVEQRLCRLVIPSSYALTRRFEFLQLVKTPRHFLAAANLIDQIDFLMAKQRMVKYMLKRSQEFVIGGYTAGNPFDALIVGCYEGSKLKFVSKVRNGFLQHMRCAMMPLLQELRTEKCPFVKLPEKRCGPWALVAKEEPANRGPTHLGSKSSIPPTHKNLARDNKESRCIFP